MFAQPFGRSDEVGNIGREIGVNKVSITAPQTGKVEPKHPVPFQIKLPADVSNYPQRTGTGKAMRENRVSVGVLVNGHFQAGRKVLPPAVGKGDAGGIQNTDGLQVGGNNITSKAKLMQNSVFNYLLPLIDGV